jgi:hypothetical protein
MSDKPENVMSTPSEDTALRLREADLQVALQGAASLWASATTGESERLQDLLKGQAAQRLLILPARLKTAGRG